jgi:hypothetical protein
MKLLNAEEKIVTHVDDQVPDKINYSVSSKDGQEYSVYLMWSDLKNNHNKYYIVQVLEPKPTNGKAYLWTRYGRVGNDGVASRILL